MKKLFKVLLLTVAICGLTACGNVKESDVIDEVKVETEEDSVEETESSSTDEVTTQEESTEVTEQQDETYEQVVDGEDINNETENNPDGSYFGIWKVTTYFMPGVTALPKEVADEYIGKICEYSEDSFIGDGAVTNAPDYQECEMAANDFSTNYGGVTFDSVGITADSVKQVNVSNSFDFGSCFYVKDANTILISSDGVFFEAVRQ